MKNLNDDAHNKTFARAYTLTSMENPHYARRGWIFASTNNGNYSRWRAIRDANEAGYAIRGAGSRLPRKNWMNERSLYALIIADWQET